MKITELQLLVCVVRSSALQQCRERACEHGCQILLTRPGRKRVLLTEKL